MAADGTVGIPRALLPAPDTSAVPDTLGDAGLLAIDVPALPGAARYEAQVAQDADFTQVLRHGRFADGHLRWRALDDGRYYLSVRGVDDAGIPGRPAVLPFTVKPARGTLNHALRCAVVGTGRARCSARRCRRHVPRAGRQQRAIQPARVDAQRLTMPAADPRRPATIWRRASLRELPSTNRPGAICAAPTLQGGRPPGRRSLHSLRRRTANPQAPALAARRPTFRLQLARAATRLSTSRAGTSRCGRWTGDLAAASTGAHPGGNHGAPDQSRPAADPLGTGILRCGPAGPRLGPAVDA